MPTLHLNSCPAMKSDCGGGTVIAITEDGPLPRRTVEIKTTADANAALLTYAAELAATGKPCVAFMRLARGDRAPPGFRQLQAANHYESINL